MRRRKFIGGGLGVAGLCFVGSGVASATDSQLSAANTELVDAFPDLKVAVEESREAFSSEEIERALSLLRDSLDSTESEAPSDHTGDVTVLGVMCVKIRRWQVLAISYAIDAGQSISSIEVDPTGKVKITTRSLFEQWRISRYGRGSQVRAWIKKQSWPKKACISEGPA